MLLCEETDTTDWGLKSDSEGSDCMHKHFRDTLTWYFLFNACTRYVIFKNLCPSMKENFQTDFLKKLAVEFNYQVFLSFLVVHKKGVFYHFNHLKPGMSLVWYLTQRPLWIKEKVEKWGWILRFKPACKEVIPQCLHSIHHQNHNREKQVGIHNIQVGFSFQSAGQQPGDAL